jgi:DNA invertase Pin-like site-specific DNA recombinase
MQAKNRVPAAQYLRMSTEHQQYSLDNQAATISRYADLNTFAVTHTYRDHGKSGLVLKKRQGLCKLLNDVIHGNPPYKAILVYDVSRWGRFQDSDESAHYEFLCKSAGVPVHYCAEQFVNDGSVSSSIMKALKRTMAAEYSRELGIKVYDGLERLVLMGFRVGAVPGYGLRRMLVSDKGKCKQLLKSGEYKSISTDRVILVPGPKEEVRWVQEIYDMALHRKSRAWITRELNRRGVPWVDGKPWNWQAVAQVLKNPKYTGSNQWAQTSQKLHAGTVRNPPEKRVVMPQAFSSIIEKRVFDRVQKICNLCPTALWGDLKDNSIAVSSTVKRSPINCPSLNLI